MKTSEKKKQKNKEWRIKNKDKCREYKRNWRMKPENNQKEIEKGRIWREKNPNYSKYLNIKQKKIVIYHYSNGENKCKCCGENIFEFLSIDHIEGGGTLHRKSIKSRLYPWLIKNNLPKGFQVLCFNCNFGKYKMGICPHKI